MLNRLPALPMRGESTSARTERLKQATNRGVDGVYRVRVGKHSITSGSRSTALEIAFRRVLKCSNFIYAVISHIDDSAGMLPPLYTVLSFTPARKKRSGLVESSIACPQQHPRRESEWRAVGPLRLCFVKSMEFASAPAAAAVAVYNAMAVQT